MKGGRRMYKVTIVVWVMLVFLCGCSAAYVPFPVEDRPAEKGYSGNDTTLAARFAEASVSHPELSGAHLLDKGEDSLLWRGVLTEQAEKSIDIQTFIWSDDNVGTIGAARLLQAAERGVRIRVLLDYITVNVDSDYLVWLNDHPNIIIRLYNPYPAMDAPLGLGKLSALTSFSRFNRRMHNKLFLVDGKVAVVGGRNNADEYYDLDPSMNFRDRDLLVVGAVLPDVRRAFDKYWNSDWAIAIERILPREIDQEERAVYYRELKAYDDDPANMPPRFHTALANLEQQLAALPEQLFWGKADIVYDIPGKNEDLTSLSGYGNTGEFLTRSFLEAKREVVVETPYMITMPGTLDLLATLQERGVKVRMLTDSMASAEDDLVFSAYKRQRRAILKRGVELYELRPDAAMRLTVFERFSDLEEVPRISLHAKTAVVDEQTLLIGSFNLDPRSTHINTEYVFRMDNPALAARVAAIIRSDMDLENCWLVSMDEEQGLSWTTRRDGQEDVSHIEPAVSLWERMRLLFFMILPMDAIL